MADRATWAKRVKEWRASGQTSEAFCEGKPFTAGGLRNAAHLVERDGAAPAVRIARVVRVRESTAPPAPDAPDVPVIVELGGARVLVSRGVDRDALATVLDLLAARGGAS